MSLPLFSPKIFELSYLVLHNRADNTYFERWFWTAFIFPRSIDFSHDPFGEDYFLRKQIVRGIAVAPHFSVGRAPPTNGHRSSSGHISCKNSATRDTRCATLRKCNGFLLRPHSLYPSVPNQNPQSAWVQTDAASTTTDGFL